MTSDNGLAQPNPVERADAPSFRILIVDDTPAIHEDFRKILCKKAPAEFEQTKAAFLGFTEEGQPERGFLLDSAHQGSEALELVQQAAKAGWSYDLAFLDVRMPPGWNGVETARRLWEVDPQLQIVMCTAYSDYSWSQMCGSLGQTDKLVILKKPFDAVEILQLAHALTTKSALANQVRRRMDELDQLVADRTQKLRLANEILIADIAGRKKTEFRLSAFTALGKRLSAAQNAKEAAEIIVDVADQLIGWDACVCELYSASKDLLFHLLSKDIVNGKRTECYAELSSHKPTELAQKAIEQGGQLILREDVSSPHPGGIPFGDRKRASASILYVAIRNGNQVNGVLSIQSYTPHAYDQQSLQTLQALADHCGGALNRLKSEEVLRQTELQLRQSQKMEAIGLLAGGVAHDFNNLLSVILSNAELAMMYDSPFSVNAVECIKQIVSAADRATNLTRQLLTFSRKEVVHAEAMGLNNHIGQLSKMLRRIIGEDIQLRCAYAENLPLVRADAGMLDQVIMNLVVNSRDAMPSGGELRIATRSVEFDESQIHKHPEGREGRFSCLSVADTGAGIPPEHLSRIFEPFFTTKETGKGTGLGLSLVFGIVKQHKGWVEVQSKPGAGTTFEIFLPALDRIEGAPARQKSRFSARGGSEVILLVEDDFAVRRASRLILEDAGYQLIEAATGREALDVWSRHSKKIDLLLTDMVMPGGMNGNVLAEQLLAAKPDLKVIFISGYSGGVSQDNAKTLERPHCRFVKKPCARDELLRVIRDLLDEDAGCYEDE